MLKIILKYRILCTSNRLSPIILFQRKQLLTHMYDCFFRKEVQSFGTRKGGDALLLERVCRKVRYHCVYTLHARNRISSSIDYNYPGFGTNNKDLLATCL